MCRVLKVTRSSYYRWKKGIIGKRKQEDNVLLPYIRNIFIDSRETYGCIRIKDSLRDLGFNIGKNRIVRLMKENDLKPKMLRRYKTTTKSKHKRLVFPNLLNQNFSASYPNQVWTSDITYIWTGEGWLYLGVVLDVYSRMIVGWSMSNRLFDKLVIDSFNNAWWKRKPVLGVTFHSDKGSQYCSKDFIRLLSKRLVKQSMSGTGNCYDNAITESFFHTLKTECVYHYYFKTRNDARKYIFDYIEIFYNRKRKHSAIGYNSPVAFEKLKKVA
jgi:transposase InsO family protein